MLILEYVNDLNPIIKDDLLLEISFEPIKQQLKRDLKDWEGEKMVRSESGRLGGIKSGESRRKKQKEANEASASIASSNEANEAVSVTVSVTDINKLTAYCKELISNSDWKFSIYKLHNINEGSIPNCFNKFIAHLVATNDTNKTKTEFAKHFSNWLKTNKPAGSVMSNI